MKSRDILSDLKRNVIIKDTQQSNDSNENDLIYFFTENNADTTFNRAIIELTGQYSTLESWVAMKNALEYSPELFVESDAVKIIQNANANFPNENADISFNILSVVCICLNQIIKNPYNLLLINSDLLQFFLKLPDCFTSGFKRGILSSSDIVQALIKTYDPTNQADESILQAFYHIQRSIIELISAGSLPEMTVSLLMPLLDDMIKITNEEDAQAMLEFFANCIDIDKSMDISRFATESILNLLTKFPDLYNLIIEEPYNYLKEFITLFNKECGCTQCVAQIIKPLLYNEKGCSILFELGYYNALLESFAKLIKLPNNIKAVYYLLEDITILCENSQDGCTFFIMNNLLENENLIDCPFKIMIYIVRIIFATLQFNLLPPSEAVAQLTINVVEKCLESEDPDILIKSLAIVQFLHDQNIDIIERVKEQLEQLSIGEYGEEISNGSLALIHLIDKQ